MLYWYFVAVCDLSCDWLLCLLSQCWLAVLCCKHCADWLCCVARTVLIGCAVLQYSSGCRAHVHAHISVLATTSYEFCQLWVSVSTFCDLCCAWWADPISGWNLNRDFSTLGDLNWTIKIRFKRLRFHLRFDFKFLRFDLKKVKSRQNQLLA